MKEEDKPKGKKKFLQPFKNSKLRKADKALTPQEVEAKQHRKEELARGQAMKDREKKLYLKKILIEKYGLTESQVDVWCQLADGHKRLNAYILVIQEDMVEEIKRKAMERGVRLLKGRQTELEARYILCPTMIGQGHKEWRFVKYNVKKHGEFKLIKEGEAPEGVITHKQSSGKQARVKSNGMDFIITPPSLPQPLTQADLRTRKQLHDFAVMAARQSFYAYVLLMGPVIVPGFKDGAHIRLICDKLQEAHEKPNARLMLFLPPGSCKSVLGSILFPSWIYGKEPYWQVLHVTHTADFTMGFGGKIRDLIRSVEYQTIFPNTKINPEIASKAHWETTMKGVYRAAGVGGAIAGKRGHIGVCDDLVTEQTAGSKLEMEKIYEWWPQGFESRILEGGKIVLINTRWSTMDISAWLLERSKTHPEIDQWEVIKIPAILTKEAALLLGHPEGTSYWPELWSDENLRKKKISFPRSQWEALYQQEPITLDGNIIKTDSIQRFATNTPIKANYIVASCDTAFSTKTTADFSVIQIWACCEEEREDHDGKNKEVVTSLYLIDMFRGRVEYPDLVARCQALETKHRPDMWIIEKKASGQSLIQDLHRRGFFIKEVIPERDKVTRAIACTPFIDDGHIFFPETTWAEDIIDECKAFLKGAHDDTVDAMTQAILEMRNSYHLRYETDKTDEDYEEEHEKARSRKMYW